MKTDPYSQQQDCRSLKVLFSDARITLILLGVQSSSGRGYTVRMPWMKMAMFKLYAQKYLANGK